MDKKARSTIEMNDPASRPAIAKMPDVGAYDRIYVGFPIWWYVAPRIINTFLEACELDGKTSSPLRPPAAAAWARLIRFSSRASAEQSSLKARCSEKVLPRQTSPHGRRAFDPEKSQGQMTLAFQLCCFFPSLTFRRTMADSTRTIPAALIGVSASL